MSRPPVRPSDAPEPRLMEDVGMKLQTQSADGSWRIVEFWTPDGEDFQIATVPDAIAADRGRKITTVRLDRREAKALRHWLDAALEVSA